MLGDPAEVRERLSSVERSRARSSQCPVTCDTLRFLLFLYIQGMARSNLTKKHNYPQNEASSPPKKCSYGSTHATLYEQRVAHIRESLGEILQLLVVRKRS